MPTFSPSRVPRVGGFSDMRLLLIEDHAPLRDAVGQYLTEAGYLVDTASPHAI